MTLAPCKLFHVAAIIQAKRGAMCYQTGVSDFLSRRLHAQDKNKLHNFIGEVTL